MAITKIPAAGFTGNNFRNIIINGDTDVLIKEQPHLLELLEVVITPACDRWRIGASILLELGSQSQDTSVPTGQGFAKSIKLDCTTANGSYKCWSTALFYTQRIEGQIFTIFKKRYFKCRKFNSIILG